MKGPPHATHLGHLCEQRRELYGPLELIFWWGWVFQVELLCVFIGAAGMKAHLTSKTKQGRGPGETPLINFCSYLPSLLQGGVCSHVLRGLSGGTLSPHLISSAPP